MVKTVDRIVDPEKSDPIINELFQIKHFFCKIPNDGASLKFIQEGLFELKNHPKYAIKSTAKLQSSNPEDALKLTIVDGLKQEVKHLPRAGQQVDVNRLKHWRDISIIQDVQGKLLMAGN